MNTNIPTVVSSIPQEFFIEPLNSPRANGYQLENFPDSLYNKAPGSVLVKLLYTLLGPIGMGLVQEGYINARLALEDSGIEGFDLDKFYGDPLSFPRVFDETYEDAGHMTTGPKWDEIKTQDTKYRSRAAMFVTGAHMGGTINGLSLVAESGLDKKVELVERFRILFDQHSGVPLEIEDIGSTRSISELTVVPITTEEDYVVGTDVNKFEYDKHHMESALSRIKPVDVFLTFQEYETGGRVNNWTNVSSSSDFSQASGFITGSNSIEWPSNDDIHWIKKNVEVEAPHTKSTHNYEFFHRVDKVSASSTHVGKFPSEQANIFPMLKSYTSDTEIFDVRRCLASKESLIRGTDVVTGQNSTRPTTLFDYVYPDTYLDYLNVNAPSNEFWAPRTGSAGTDEYIEIDLGVVKAVNFVSFETLNLPVSFDILFDALASTSGSEKNWISAVRIGPTSSLKLDPQRASAWEHVTFRLYDGTNNTIFTRFVRIKLSRLLSALQTPWTIPVRGVRVGRVS